MSFNTIIFDMDGVLIDTEYHYAQIIDAFFEKKGIPEKGYSYSTSKST
ncbi:HAD hydrolase-like protein [Lactococcus garvieae]|uniref:HAD family phosphatase n=1 Tax=Lactococcus garvieae TaxID=1363 RepID=A0AA43PH31_9LACT|nr:HAD hydrolase-like protein [Lactococcus garvieae]MDH7959533.1 hypothetical protein [Lactococcus garvieae]BDM76455.1 hypothetical protein LGMS210922A_14000 [Lactococcus garvieae]BDW51723.1 hypothetical protein LG21E68_13980 [Lactococcus garvieae]